MVPGVTFRTIDEARPGPKLAAIYAERSAAYAAWYLAEGDEARPSAATGEAEKLPPTRCCQSNSPVAAFMHVATPPSVMANR